MQNSVPKPLGHCEGRVHIHTTIVNHPNPGDPLRSGVYMLVQKYSHTWLLGRHCGETEMEDNICTCQYAEVEVYDKASAFISHECNDALLCDILKHYSCVCVCVYVCMCVEKVAVCAAGTVKRMLPWVVKL